MREEVPTRRWRPETPRRLRGAWLVAAALLLAAAVLLGCGGDGDGETNEGDETNGVAETNGAAEKALAPRVVRDGDIAAQEEESPARALLEWWQSFQFGDADQVLALTSQKTLDQVGTENLKDLVNARANILPGIEVFDSTENGDSASLRVGLLTFTPAKPGEPPPDEPTLTEPDTFAMTQEDGEWLFAATEYLESEIETLKAALEQQQESAAQ